MPPFSVRDVRNNAFSQCEALALICIPASVKMVMYSAFDDCSTLQISSTGDSNSSTGTNANKDSENVESWLRTRFHRLPLHQLCYFFIYEYFTTSSSSSSSSSSTVPSTKQKIRTLLLNKNQNDHHDNQKSGDHHDHDHDPKEILISKDGLGMTPLHILAASCSSFRHNSTGASSHCSAADDTNDNDNNNNNNSGGYPFTLCSDKQKLRFDMIQVDMWEVMNEMILLNPKIIQKKNQMNMTPLSVLLGGDQNQQDQEEGNDNINDHHRHSKGASCTEYTSLKMPLCLLVQLGIQWKDLYNIFIARNPNVTQERGLIQKRMKLRKRMSLVSNEHDKNDGTRSNNVDDNTDYDLYPFMHAAIQGDLELSYHLTLYRIDLLL